MAITATATFVKAVSSFTGQRLKYPGEGGNYNPTGMPAVTPALRLTNSGWQKYITPVKLNAQLQNIIWDVMQMKNPGVPTNRYTQILAYDVALANGNGFGDPDDPRVNYITGENLSSQLPKLMDGILMAGALYQGNVIGETFEMVPGVHAMDASRPVTAGTAIEKGWCIRCVSWHEGNGGYGEDFFPLAGGEYWIPHILSEVATYPLEYFQPWDYPYPPNPLETYL